jgi:hypothetical protein
MRRLDLVAAFVALSWSSSSSLARVSSSRDEQPPVANEDEAVPRGFFVDYETTVFSIYQKQELAITCHRKIDKDLTKTSGQLSWNKSYTMKAQNDDSLSRATSYDTCKWQLTQVTLGFSKAV